jgi:hypothetical protein
MDGRRVAILVLVGHFVTVKNAKSRHSRPDLRDGPRSGDRALHPDSLHEHDEPSRPCYQSRPYSQRTPRRQPREAPPQPAAPTKDETCPPAPLVGLPTCHQGAQPQGRHVGGLGMYVPSWQQPRRLRVAGRHAPGRVRLGRHARDTGRSGSGPLGEAPFCPGAPRERGDDPIFPDA